MTDTKLILVSESRPEPMTITFKYKLPEELEKQIEDDIKARYGDDVDFQIQFPTIRVFRYITEKDYVTKDN